MDVVLIEQKKTPLTRYGKPVYIFSYDLRKLYKLNEYNKQ